MRRFIAASCLLAASSLATANEIEKYKTADIHGMSFGTKLVIDAPVDQVWHQLIDTKSYPEWNPFTPVAETTFEVGTPIFMKVRLYREFPNNLLDVYETVADFYDYQKMCWKAHQLTVETFNSKRCYKVTPINGSQTLLENSMRYEGFLWPLVGAFTKLSVMNGFEDVSYALKKRLEDQ